jgi:hypothetical protein
MAQNKFRIAADISSGGDKIDEQSASFGESFLQFYKVKPNEDSISAEINFGNHLVANYLSGDQRVIALFSKMRSSIGTCIINMALLLYFQKHMKLVG